MIDPGSFKATWKVEVNTEEYGKVDRLFLRDDFLFVYTDGNVVQAISSDGGQTRFVRPDIVGPRDRLWPPALVDARDRLGTAIDRIICFPSGTSYLIYTETGDRVQRTSINEPITSNTTSDDGLLYVGQAGNIDGILAQVDPTREVAPVLDRTLLNGAISSKPVVFDDVVFVADDSGRVWAIGERRVQAWPRPYFQTAGAVNADLRVDEDGVYVASTDMQLYCIDRRNGRLKWSYYAEVPLFRPPFPTDDFVFQPVEGRGVACLSKTEGETARGREPVWVAENARDVLSHDDDNIYLLHRDGRIVAYDKATGEEQFRSERNDFTTFARNHTGSRIFAGRADGEIVAIDPVLRRGEVGELAYTPLYRPLVTADN